MKIRVSKEFTFNSAHYLKNYQGDCKKLHGHTYKLIVTIEDSINKETGMVIDFNKLSRIVKEEVVNKIDHELLNEIWENPTAENMAETIFNSLSKLLPVHSVKLYETPTSYVEVIR